MSKVSVPISIDDILYGNCKTCKHQRLYLEDTLRDFMGLGRRYFLHCEHEEVCNSYDARRED